jgi:hypothetical protein
MMIQNEVDYQLGMGRLESLDSTNPDNLAEMEALGNALEAYEDRCGHAPLRPRAHSARVQLATQGTQGPGHDLRTDHLRPVIDFLLAQGNRPAGWRGDAFWHDQGGEVHYTFTDPLNAAQLREQFTFPASILVYDDGSIKDSLNRVDIGQESPPLRFSFEQPVAASKGSKP